jgi:pantetheine-phosphate adenylyltransferase
MAIAVYPGSFDPITFGHLNIIERAGPLFEKLIVLVSNDPGKNYFFSPLERKSLIEKSLKKNSSVIVDVWDGLTVNYLEKAKARYIIRGIRSVSDFDHEWVMFNMNKKLSEKIDTVFIPADSEYNFISSRAMKEVATNGGELEHFVPAVVAKAVRDKIKKKDR